MGKKSTGFTIVELLIVIVVIAILAAITVVAYQGIQQQAKTSTSLSTANEIAQKASAWSATESSYPDLAQLRTNTLAPTNIDTGGGVNGPLEAKLPRPSHAIGAEMNEVRSEGGTVVTYEPCWGGSSHTGARITYWDFSKSNTATKTIGTC